MRLVYPASGGGPLVEFRLVPDGDGGVPVIVRVDPVRRQRRARELAALEAAQDEARRASRASVARLAVPLGRPSFYPAPPMDPAARQARDLQRVTRSIRRTASALALRVDPETVARLSALQAERDALTP